MNFHSKKPLKPLLKGIYACPEFESVKRWTVTEKIDGTNIRICLDKSLGGIKFGGRTSRALVDPELFNYLYDKFTYSSVCGVFPDSNFVVLFGEGYGPKVQKGGYYAKSMQFALFDVFCSGWWLGRDQVRRVADALGVAVAPELGGIWNLEEIVDFVKSRPRSILATDDHEMEGIVARSYPVMQFRKGGPIMFKLKCIDFNEEENG